MTDDRRTVWMRAGIIAAIVVAPVAGRGQEAAPLWPYTPPPSHSPLAPLPQDPAAADPPLGDVKLRSDAASNNSSADTRSPIAPILPEPAVSGDSPTAFLRSAKAALAAGRTGEAQEALERAESRLLDRDVAPSEAGTAAADPITQNVAAARQALSVGNTQAAITAIDAALAGG